MRKNTERYNLSRSELQYLIDQWIFNERHRLILADRLFNGTSYESGYSDRGGSSYARGRGRYAKRDSMGRYSRRGMSYDDDMSYARGGRIGNRGYSRDDGKQYMMDQLEEMMEDAEKPAEKEALRRCMDALKRA